MILFRRMMRFDYTTNEKGVAGEINTDYDRAARASSTQPKKKGGIILVIFLLFLVIVVASSFSSTPEH